MNKFSNVGWVPSMSPATKAEDNDIGNSGGAMLFHKPWLQTAIPTLAGDRMAETSRKETWHGSMYGYEAFASSLW